MTETTGIKYSVCGHETRGVNFAAYYYEEA